MADLEPHTTTAYTYIPAPYPGAPAFQFQLTRLTDTLLVWVGTGGPVAAEEGDDAPGAAGGEKNKRLASDWAVAMPSRGVRAGWLARDGKLTRPQNIPTTATPIFRSGATDTALHMAQRLCKFASGSRASCHAAGVLVGPAGLATGCCRLKSREGVEVEADMDAMSVATPPHLPSMIDNLANAT